MTENPSSSVNHGYLQAGLLMTWIDFAKNTGLNRLLIYQITEFNQKLHVFFVFFSHLHTIRMCFLSFPFVRYSGKA